VAVALTTSMCAHADVRVTATIRDRDLTLANACHVSDLGRMAWRHGAGISPAAKLVARLTPMAPAPNGCAAHVNGALL
jgi:hypothetical protein